MGLSRRDFLKSSTAASASAAIWMSITSDVEAAATQDQSGWSWDKAACHFYGTDCGICWLQKGKG